MASSLFSAISRRALSIRAARSSFVIGFARSRIDVNAAMLGGTGVLSAAAARPRCADSRATGHAAAAPVIDRNDRREIIRNSLLDPGSFAPADPHAFARGAPSHRSAPAGAPVAPSAEWRGEREQDSSSQDEDRALQTQDGVG